MLKSQSVIYFWGVGGKGGYRILVGQGSPPTYFVAICYVVGWRKIPPNWFEGKPFPYLNARDCPHYYY